MPVEVILALLGKKLDGAFKALAGFDGAFERWITGRHGKDIGLARQFCRRVRVRIGNERAAVEIGNAPVHRRVGGKAGFQRADVAREVAETLFNGVKAGEGPQQGKVRCPDVRGDEHGFGAGLQCHLQKIPAIQPEDGAAVGMEVADALKARGQTLRRRKGRHENDVVHFARAPVPLVDGTDLGAEHKARLERRFAGQAQLLFQREHALARLFERLGKLLAPRGVGEIARAHEADALAPGPEVEVRRVALAAGGPGETRMDVQIGDQHGKPRKKCRQTMLPAKNGP